MSDRNREKIKVYDIVKSKIIIVVNEFMYYLMTIGQITFAIILVNTILAKMGYGVPFLPAPHEYWLAAIAGAFWLFGGRK